MGPRSQRQFGRQLILLLASLAAVGDGQAQQPTGDSAGDEELPTTIDSRSGYIDTALPLRQIRLRSDFAYNNNNPARGEFFYANTGPNGPGLPLDERSVDYQDLTLYLEYVFGERFSIFLDVPVRFANFDINDNHTGLSDINAGFKYAFWYTPETVATAQFRVYTPTGDARRGLGNDHVSIEPAGLLYHRFSDCLTSESELRVFVPVGGTEDIVSTVIRYGTGLSYALWSQKEWQFSPVVEVVGWTFLDGKKDPPFGSTLPQVSAAGDTIVNAKLGARLKLGERFDIYAGYGRALTGEVLYKDIYRLEARVLYGPRSCGESDHASDGWENPRPGTREWYESGCYKCVTSGLAASAVK